jgi:hypothetical protein
MIGLVRLASKIVLGLLNRRLLGLMAEYSARERKE